jgi:hypothetical protein
VLHEDIKVGIRSDNVRMPHQLCIVVYWMLLSVAVDIVEVCEEGIADVENLGGFNDKYLLSA